MQHPFTQTLEQTVTESISGGTLVSLRHQIELKGSSPKPTPIKPEIGSTMAIGEEGGGFWF